MNDESFLNCGTEREESHKSIKRVTQSPNILVLKILFAWKGLGTAGNLLF